MVFADVDFYSSFCLFVCLFAVVVVVVIVIFIVAVVCLLSYLVIDALYARLPLCVSRRRAFSEQPIRNGQKRTHTTLKRQEKKHSTAK